MKRILTACRHIPADTISFLFAGLIIAIVHGIEFHRWNLLIEMLITVALIIILEYNKVAKWK